MATTVKVMLNKTSHQVTFDGGVKELLSAIVKSFGDILTSVEEIGELKVYNDDEEEFIKMETTHGFDIITSSKLDDHLFSLLLSSTSVADRARLPSVSSPHAASWLSVIPSECSTTNFGISGRRPVVEPTLVYTWKLAKT
eukprot:Em0015g876a